MGRKINNQYKSMELTKYHNFAVKTALKAGEILLDYAKTDLQIKYKSSDKKDLVTKADYMSEKYIVDAVKKHFPGHCILSEEGGDCGIKPSQYRWVIDPLDGTTNYAHGYPFYCVSIALTRQNKILAGVIYAPVLKTMFHASEGHGAYLNKTRLKVSSVKKIETAFLSTGFNPYEKGRNLPVFSSILPKVQAIRRAGSAALDLAYTAAGSFDGYWEYAINIWDVAAGILLVTEAGGKISDLHGKALNMQKNGHLNILATNGKIHSGMVRAINSSNKK